MQNVNEDNTPVNVIVEATTRYKKVILHDFEMEILAQLSIYRMVNSKFVIDMYKAARERNGYAKSSRNAISQRLQKLLNAGLLNQHKRMGNSTGFIARTYYSLTERCINTLMLSKKINSGDGEQLLSFYKRHGVTFPSVHSEAITALGLQLQQSITDQDLNSSIRLMRGSQHHLLGSTKDTDDETKNLIVPDLVVEVGKHTIVAIEVDGGRQTSGIIQGKVKRYEKFMKTLAGKRKELYVVFVPIDDNLLVEDSQRKERLRRVFNLKRLIEDEASWGENIHYYAQRAMEMSNFILRIYNRLEYRSILQEENTVQEWLFKMSTYVSNEDYLITTCEEQDLHATAVANIYSPHAITVCKQPNKKQKIYYVYRMATGSSRNYQRLLGALEKCRAINESDSNQLKVSLLLLYWDESTMMNDVIDFSQNSEVEVLATAFDQWDVERDREVVVNATAANAAIYDIPIYEFVRTNLAFTRRKEAYRL